VRATTDFFRDQEWDFAPNERSPLPGSPATPDHPFARRLGYGAIGVLLGITGGLGTAIVAVVPRQLWVIANYKEAQTSRMTPGQRAWFEVDALEVAQRISVRIAVEPNQDLSGRLRPGMSVEARVDTTGALKP